jgi:hypothetical protein
MILVHLKTIWYSVFSRDCEALIVHVKGGFMVKSKDRSTIKFDLKHETIAALKIAAAVWQIDPRDVLENLVAEHLKSFVTLAINNKSKE